MASREQREEHRTAVQRAVYERTEGNTSRTVDAMEIAGELGIERADMAAACEYLEGKEKIEVTGWGMGPTPGLLSLTHDGLVEMEDEEEG
ncbi:hypothetical protein [Streptomyces sp. BA2]|uniref:hypothetical protein n=1 Tax=Streptomyces sp. BA2 TaxID=436595 RepID=UPI00132B6460|nr:hypothetical protein [Streptomyces sp. BA2]MWA15440.1 hypothetical protein [Streptomyces sp. BA2]